jgi:hypothetical protein
MATTSVATEWDAQGKPIQPLGARPSVTEWDANGKPVSSDITSNPNGEGTYRMVGRSGPVQIPYSNVTAAKGQGMMFSGASDRDRYAKDAAADPNADSRSLLQKAKDRFDIAQQQVAGAGPDGVPQLAAHPQTPAMQSSLLAPSTYGKAISDTVSGLAKPLAHIPSQIASYGGFKNPADQGGPIQSIVNNPDKGAGVADALTQVGTGLLLGKATEAVAPAVDAISNKISSMRGNSVISGQNYTPNHARAFEGAIAPATSMGKNFIPQTVTPEALSPIRGTAARMAQGTPVEQGIVKTATSSSTPPLDRIGAYQKIVQNAIGDLEAQHAPALAQSANVPVDTTPIVQRLRARISPTTAPADASAIQELIGRVKQAKTIGDLNTFRQELNDETAPQYRMSQVQAGRTGVSAEAANDLTGWVRNAYYDNLEQATGQDYGPLKRQEANLMTVQEALQNQQAPLSQAEAKFSAPTTIREKMGNGANLFRDPKTTLTQTFLRETPATKVSTLLQKSLDDLPTGNGPSASSPSSGGPSQNSLVLKGQPPTVQGTPVNPFPPSGPPRLGNPQGTIQAPVTLRGLPSRYRAPQLPSSTARNVPAESSPSPQLNEATARMRVQPNRFNTKPSPSPSSGPVPVTPEGQAGVPASRYLQPPHPETTPANAPKLTGRALWTKNGAQNLAAHGVDASDLDALSQTAKGKQLLVFASSLKPGSPAMKNLVRQIDAELRK